jgi:hypothetical protein
LAAATSKGPVGLGRWLDGGKEEVRKVHNPYRYLGYLSDQSLIAKIYMVQDRHNMG